MVIPSFRFVTNPVFVFGAGKLKTLPEELNGAGKNLLIIGGNSFIASKAWSLLSNDLHKNNFKIHPVTVSGEPSPELINKLAAEFRSKNIDVVIAIGGGSTIDIGKAVSAMIPVDEPVENFLEGIGTKNHSGEKIRFIAIPTTAGTGSEATKNAVLSRVGSDGYKRSLRHDNFVPDLALVDPELTLSCPPSVTSYVGLDAFTQLLESYVSFKATPLTDALALSGIEHIKNALISACTAKQNDVDVRSALSYGAYLSGITLANAGLGTVHGFASSIGGRFTIPHGVICGTLLAEVTEANILKSELAANLSYLDKYARVGLLINNKPYGTISKKLRIEGCALLIETLSRWVDELDIPRLGTFGITEKDVEPLSHETDNKYNPVPLQKNDLKKILITRL